MIQHVSLAVMSMERTLVLNGYKVSFRMDAHALHIDNDTALQQLIAAEPATVADQLALRLLDIHERTYGRRLELKPDSLSVEILGHIYAGRLAQVLEQLTELKLLDKVAGVVLDACAVIDCGEAGHDRNRWLWDLLAPFKDRIAGWLTSND